MRTQLRVLPRVTVILFNVATARVFREIHARGNPETHCPDLFACLANADLG